MLQLRKSYVVIKFIGLLMELRRQIVEFACMAPQKNYQDIITQFAFFPKWSCGSQYARDTKYREKPEVSHYI